MRTRIVIRSAMKKMNARKRPCVCIAVHRALPCANTVQELTSVLLQNPVVKLGEGCPFGAL